MFTWRITKYNPVCRDEFGRYTKNEWTSFSEIGKSFDGYKLTKSDYLAVENAYVDAIVAFMDSAKIKSLTARCLEKRKLLKQNQDIYPDEMNNLYETLKENNVLSVNEIQYLARMLLREDLWCKLEKDDTMFVHFGYDYYMYIGSSQSCEDAIEIATRMGLFVEDYESPYV